MVSGERGEVESGVEDGIGRDEDWEGVDGGVWCGV